MDALLISLLLLIILKRRKRRRIQNHRRPIHRRHWVHPILTSRNKNGQHKLLFEELKCYPDKFFKYFRMSVNSFNELLSVLHDDLKHQDTRMRKSISPTERLAITLSYNPNEEFGRSEVLHFAPPSEDEAEFSPSTYLKKGKVSRQDPMSHRIIEKRRRDRMNNCLADLSRLIPPEYLKKGRGRVEKTEIIEMAIRHIKYMQERTNAAGSQRGEEFRAGYQEAVSEAVRFLTGQGYCHGEGLCTQLVSRLKRHCEYITKGEIPQEKHRQSDVGSSSETTSSFSSPQGFSGKPAAAVQSGPSHNYPPDSCEERELYPMECDRDAVQQISTAADSDAMEPVPLLLDGSRKRDPTLRAFRKPDHNEEYLHSYKFKNSIERRFSRSLDTEASESHVHGVKVLTHKRRRISKPVPSMSTSNSGSTEETRDTSPQDTSSESQTNHNEKHTAVTPSQYVPIFALNSLGKYYIPLSVDYACLSRALGPYDALDARGGHLTTSLHPVTIHVNYQPGIDFHVKREPSERDWRPT